MKRYTGIGTMSGTSMDGLDLVACTFEIDGDQYSFSVDHAQTVPFDEKWHARLYHLRDQSAEVYAKTNVYFGHWLGETIQSFIREFDISPDFAAIHGQTIFHQPNLNFTSQIGDGETVASYLPCPLVSNFRNKDIALGGQGAPLISLGEKYLFPDYPLFLNLGGFSNVTFGSIAFDLTPVNIVLNYLWSQREQVTEVQFDEDGDFARKGSFIEPLFDALNELPYYHQAPPKSLGWEWVQEEVLPLLNHYPANLEDRMHTFTHHVVFQIARGLEQIQAEGHSMLVTGGGGHNGFLMELLQNSLQPLQITISQDAPKQWVDFKEAIVFAFLGLRTLEGKTTTIQGVTGASQASVTGSIHLPPNGGYSLL
ncbi:anhydro-N-acetylmuramic acid kinase [Pontibacter sp. G13]|uniref:anhydro-N-acetylmuramic acid kinase n=1 Tax=Pontibacter sp. G13 TaxID=3074898 RepID=UPI00288A8294|nr:anhydro-N-acetylmuramic acid kinase [Pontibacter sp. G13]WNJ21424.1 anhydro-N-acetylmuramic acid kinase [Pontibacter sp. G13]